VNTSHGMWSDEQVQAFVDGELDAASRAQIEALLPHDAGLAARIAQQRALRAQLLGAFDPVLDEPVPQRLLQAMEGSGGVATPIGAASRPARAASRQWWWGAAAAGVLAAVLVTWNFPRERNTALLVSASDGLHAAGALDQALSRQLSAAGPDDAGVQVSLSFRAGDGRYCRVFNLSSGIDGLACRTEDHWRVEATGRTVRSPGDEYRQAASALSPAVLSAISSRQPGDALTPEQERGVREDGWR
jgi:hypothetical protein